MYCRPTACPCAPGEPVPSKGPRPASTGSRTYHEQQRPVLARRAVPPKERHEKDEDAHDNEGWRPVCPPARARQCAGPGDAAGVHGQRGDVHVGRIEMSEVSGFTKAAHTEKPISMMPVACPRVPVPCIPAAVSVPARARLPTEAGCWTVPGR